jgi:hypothetical protein
MPDQTGETSHHRCGHCLQPLAVDASGQVARCPDHPDGHIEFFAVTELGD